MNRSVSARSTSVKTSVWNARMSNGSPTSAVPMSRQPSICSRYTRHLSAGSTASMPAIYNILWTIRRKSLLKAERLSPMAVEVELVRARPSPDAACSALRAAFVPQTISTRLTRRTASISRRAKALLVAGRPISPLPAAVAARGFIRQLPASAKFPTAGRPTAQRGCLRR